VKTQTQAAPLAAVELLGELHPLMAQLGSADGLRTLGGVAAALRLPRVDSPAALVAFLGAYRAEVLRPQELPAIRRAYVHASRGETRELIALDRDLGALPLPPDLASASRRVGRCHLERLRPLRDQRVVQRYLQAVEEDHAQGWHTLVYGLTLAVYSLPLRQGLLSYARHTVRGFIGAAARPLQLTAEECGALLAEHCADLLRELEDIVAAEAVSGPTAPPGV
jgi:urease accessory protein UreF